MTDHEPPTVSPNAVAARLAQIEDELHGVLALLPGLFGGMATPDARYCRYNLKHAALSIAVASNRITSSTGSTPDH